MFKLNKRVIDVFIYFTLFASVVLLVLAGVLGSYAFSREPYVVEEIVVARASAISEYSIVFNLKPNEIYGTSIAYGGKPIPIYLTLAQEAVVKHTFRLTYGIASGNYSLSIYVAHPDGWTKEIRKTREGFTEKSSVARLESLNITEIRLLMENLSKQVGIRLTSYDIVVVAEVSYSVTLASQVKKGSIEHSIKLEVDLSRGLITVRGESSQSKLETATTKVVTPVTLAGIHVEVLRTVSPVIGVVGLSLLSAYLVMSAKFKETSRVLRLERKYRDVIVEGSKLPDFSSNEIAVLKDLEELVKVARIVEKPVIKVTPNPDKIVYYIVDRRTVYIVEESLPSPTEG
ncbi:MAG: DUF5305 family protein [Sulfolobales archaeon]